MAEYTTHYFPKHSSYQPSDQASEASVAFLEGIYPYSAAHVCRHARPQVITSGADFDRFTCPACNSDVQQYYLDEQGKHWWYVVLWDLQDQQQILTVPCCKAEIKVEQINFGNDVGFASFQIDIEGAGEDERLDEKQMHALSAMIGCDMRCIIFVSD
jgi:hypothetical protein